MAGAGDIIELAVGEACIVSGIGSGEVKVIVLKADGKTARLKIMPVDPFKVELETAAERAKGLQPLP